MDAMEKFRIAQTLPYIEGRLLDVGCGYNNLVARYGSGIGVDIYQWPGIDILVDSISNLPFKDRCFDTVSMLAMLNHVPNRRQALSEINRILSDSGRLLITMIDPRTGIIAHIIFRRDHSVRGKSMGELKGMTRKNVRRELSDSGFAVIQEIPFEFGFNCLYVAKKIK